MKKFLYLLLPLLVGCGGGGGDSDDDKRPDLTSSSTINTFDCDSQEVSAEAAEDIIADAEEEGLTVEDNRTDFAKTVVIANCGSTVIVDNSSVSTETNIGNVDGSGEGGDSE